MTRPFRPLPAPADRRRSFRPRPEALEGRQLLSAGMIDPGFGTNGVALTIVSTDPSSSYDMANAIQIQADGKIVAAGRAPGTRTGEDFALARYDANGTLDTTFGAGGKVLTDFVGKADGVTDLALQAGGKIIAVGSSDQNTSKKNGSLPNYDFALARYNANGTLDTTFGPGRNGKVTTGISTSASADPYYNFHDRASAVVLQPDGKIVVAGISSNGSNLDFAVVRYDADGNLDTTFGSGGKVTTAMGSGDDRLNGLALQTDGKIVVTGEAQGRSGLALARFTSAGLLDPTFGPDGTGKVMAANTLNFRAFDLVIQPDGMIAVAGDALIGGNDEFALARYNTNGTLDTTFNSGGPNPGIATIGTPSSQDVGYAVALQGDGKFVIAGQSKGGTSWEDTALARLNANGSPDNTFGTAGFMVRSFDTGADMAVDLAIDPYGRIVTAGFAGNLTAGVAGSNRPAFAVARFLGDAPAPLHASAAAPHAVHQHLTPAQARPALTQALAYWQARGDSTSRLGHLDLVIADLGGDRLGQASGSTITLDDDAAGWGWSVGRGRSSRGGRMDLISALTHEVGHLLGHDHAEGGVMAETLSPGVRTIPAHRGVVAAPTSGHDHPLPAFAHTPSRLGIQVLRGHGRRPRAAARG